MQILPMCSAEASRRPACGPVSRRVSDGSQHQDRNCPDCEQKAKVDDGSHGGPPPQHRPAALQLKPRRETLL
jgi:hypothetical protein